MPSEDLTNLHKKFESLIFFVANYGKMTKTAAACPFGYAAADCQRVWNVQRTITFVTVVEPMETMYTPGTTLARMWSVPRLYIGISRPSAPQILTVRSPAPVTTISRPSTRMTALSASAPHIPEKSGLATSDGRDSPLS